jgi:hypothetical protein
VVFYPDLSVRDRIDSVAPMKRIVGVVLAFVVLNTLGFVVYRAFSTTDAAASNLDSAPATTATLARDPAGSQPKPSPAVSGLLDEKSSVSEPTPAAAVEVQPPPARAPSTQRTRVNPKPILQKRVDKTPPPAMPVKSTTEVKPAATEPKPADNDHVLEMEANPYKRGE